MTRYGKTREWPATAVAAAGNPIDLTPRLKLHTFEPLAKPATHWHTWARFCADAVPSKLE